MNYMNYYARQSQQLKSNPIEEIEFVGDRKTKALRSHRVHTLIKSFTWSSSVAFHAGYPRIVLIGRPSFVSDLLFFFLLQFPSDGISLSAVYSESDPGYDGMTSLPLPGGSETCSVFLSSLLAVLPFSSVVSRALSIRREALRCLNRVFLVSQKSRISRYIVENFLLLGIFERVPRGKVIVARLICEPRSFRMRHCG